MRKYLKITTLFIVSLVLCDYLYANACDSTNLLYKLAIPKMDEPRSAVFNVTQQQMEDLIDAATNGDTKATIRLWQYYKLYKNDEKSALAWLKIAAERGDPAAQYNLGCQLERFGKNQEAMMWYKSAAKQSNEQAQKKLKKLGGRDVE